MSGDDQSIGIGGSRVGVASTGENANIDSPVYENCVFYELGVNGNLSSHHGAAPSIDLSYYRIDRGDQLAVLESLPSGGRPQVCVFRGEVTQCLDKFLECLCESEWKTHVFGRASKIFYKFINWPWEKAGADAVRREGLSLLAREFGIPDEQAAPETIYAAAGHMPVLVHTMITPERFSSLPDGRAALRRFVEFWASWPARDRSDAPFLACMVVLKGREHTENAYRASGMRRWLGQITGVFRKRRDIEACIKALSSDQRVAREFESVIFDHVYTWAKEPDIRDRISRSGLDPAAAIQGIFDQWGSRAIPMQNLAQALAVKFPKHLPPVQAQGPRNRQESP